LADMFLEFIGSEAFQTIIPETNWMYPAFATPLPEGFTSLIQPQPVTLPALTVEYRKMAMDEWLIALSQ